MSKIDTLEELYLEQLKELYSAEIQLIDILPEMAQTARQPRLKANFQHHLDETYRHVERIEQLLEALGQSPMGHPCAAINALVAEGRRLIGDRSPANAKDAVLIEIARSIEHYEITGYGCVRIYASLLGEDAAIYLIQSTLDEEAEMERCLESAAQKLKVGGETVPSYRGYPRKPEWVSAKPRV